MTVIINRLAAEAIAKTTERIASAEREKAALIESAAKLLEDSITDKDSPAYPLAAAAANHIRENLGNESLGGKRLPYRCLDFGLSIADSAGRGPELSIVSLASDYSHYWPGCGCNFDRDPLKLAKEKIIALEYQINAAKAELAAAQKRIA